MNSLKRVTKAILPKPALMAIRKYRPKFKDYRNLSTQEVFSKIYETGFWGKSGDPSQPYCSGNGSRDGTILSAYITAVQDFLGNLAKKPHVVDLGCGDFFVGARIRPLCDSYTACDIVPKLIEFNREKFKPLNVDFRVLDLTTDELPRGDVVFIRQVLQHLSNEQIARALPKIASQYKFLVLTEHLPETPRFEPNLDKPAGPDIRTCVDSGVVLTSPPFSLKAKHERLLC